MENRIYKESYNQYLEITKLIKTNNTLSLEKIFNKLKKINNDINVINFNIEDNLFDLSYKNIIVTIKEINNKIIVLPDVEMQDDNNKIIYKKWKIE